LNDKIVTTWCQERDDLKEMWLEMNERNSCNESARIPVLNHEDCGISFCWEATMMANLSEQEMLAMAGYGHMLSNNAVQHITLGPGQDRQDYGDLAVVYDPAMGMNQDVIIPHCENIQPIINHIFGLGDVQSCTVTRGG